MIEDDPAYKEGYNDFYARVEYDDNPYEIFTEERAYWDMGWIDASVEYVLAGIKF